MPSRKILLVDDEPLVTEELQEALEDEGYAVETESRVAAALARDDVAAFDLIVTDLKMPGAGGLDLLRGIRDLPGPGPKVIVLSGHGAERNREEATALGAAECFAKPVDVDDLIDAIEAACGG